MKKKLVVINLVILLLALLLRKMNIERQMHINLRLNMNH